jgi:exonuclease III
MLTRDADILEYTGEDILPADQNQPPDLLLFQSTRLRGPSSDRSSQEANGYVSVFSLSFGKFIYMLFREGPN